MQVSARKQGPVWRVRLLPEAGSEHTLIDAGGVAALETILDEAEAAGCRVLVLEGGPASFCEGLDLAGLLESGAEPTLAVNRFAVCLGRLRQSPALVIACVEGSCAGGGVGLAASADLLLCTAAASFVLPELVLGLLPAVVLPVLLERMPRQKACLLALGGAIDGRQALGLGLADRVVEQPGQLEAALRAAIKQGLRSHPAALSELKQLTACLAGVPCQGGLQIGAARSAELLADPDRRDGLRSFLEGEPLPWFDRYQPGEMV